MSVWGIVLAAGSATRYGLDLPKQYERLGGRRVLDWSLEAIRATCDGVILVVSEAHVDSDEPGVDAVVRGGETRSASVRAGLAAVPDDADIVVVQDAARPLAGVALYDVVIEAVLAGADGAVPAIAVTDTIKRVDDQGRVSETLERDELVAVQTPQAFRADVLREAHVDDPDATDDATLVEDLGFTVVVVPGDPRNLKITYAADVHVAELYLVG
jgi:2-C-methyl-D-erythritol 4-phosphate cytidylyltransferase